MLVQLIYRSRSQQRFGAQALRELGAELTQRNRDLQLRGLLLYDGSYFLQVLEGQAQTVDRVYQSLSADARHTDIVLLLRDPIPRSHFDDFRMDIVDVRDVQRAHSAANAAQRMRNLGLHWNQDHRFARIIEAFVQGRWRDAVPALGGPAGTAGPSTSGEASGPR